MEYLIRRGMPQRTAHGLVGKLVRKALDRGVPLAELDWRISRRPIRRSTRAFTTCWAWRMPSRRYASYGSTGPQQVAEQLFQWKQKLTFNPVS